MQVLLAPSKTMSVKYKLPEAIAVTRPRFWEDAHLIVSAIQARENVAALMHVSGSIAKNVQAMYDRWSNQETPALYAYRGDAYRWFFADTLSADDLRWAQEHLFILSGLYGALRPLDLVSPYRLEMKTKLPIGTRNDLYSFWGTRIAQYVDAVDDDVICNLSSDEYARVVTKWTRKRVVTPVFLDKKKNGTVGTVPIYSKMMRGVMARWIIDHRIENPADLYTFSAQGYAYSASKSRQDMPAFYRETSKPIRF